MKPEQKLWHRILRPALDRIPGLVYERVEVRTGRSGIPDVMYSCGGTGWIENKVSAAKRGISLSDWTHEQRIWTRRHSDAGSRIWLFVASPLGSHLIDPTEITDRGYISFDSEAIRGYWFSAVNSLDLQRMLKIRSNGT